MAAHLMHASAVVSGGLQPGHYRLERSNLCCPELEGSLPDAARLPLPPFLMLCDLRPCRFDRDAGKFFWWGPRRQLPSSGVLVLRQQ